MGDVKQKQTCMKCARKCLNIHRKKPSSVSNSTPLSFFKIMIGDFREVLFIPPKFDLLGELVDHSVYLEDSDGNSSRVKLSVKDGSVVFQEGWREFVLDHSIEVGEFVVFKYVGELLFSVQIFGVNACERLCFHDENKNNLCKKNKYKTESSPEELQLPKRHKSSEAVKDKCHPINENSLKKEPETKNDLSDLPDIEFIGSNGAEKDQSEPEKSPHFLGNSEGLKTEMPPSFSKQTCEKSDEVAMRVDVEGTSAFIDRPDAHCMAHKNSVCEQETSTIPSADKLNPKAQETDSNSNDAEVAVPNEEKLSHHDDSCRRSQTAPSVECTESVTKNEMNSNRDIIIYTPKIDCSKETDIAYPKMLVDEDSNLITKEKAACKFLLTEEGVCHIFDENSTVEHEARRITPIILYAGEENNGGRCNEMVDMLGEEASSKCKSILGVFCPKSTLDCSEIENCDKISKVKQSEEGLHSFGNTPVLVSRKEDAPCAGSVGSAPQNLPDMDITEGNTCQSGIMPDGFTEDDEERTTLCLKEKTLKAVKTERMDSDDLEEQSLPKSVFLSFMVSSNAQSWTELPQTLPCHIGKKRHGMRVVTLQDPSMRLWPVLYHESFKFVGFLSGWKDFVAANNLQQGNLCELIEVACEREPTFQVRISKESGKS